MLKFVSSMEVDLDAIAFNFRSVTSHVAPAVMMPVIKGNGYGHGAVAVARTLVETGARHLAVAKLVEAWELRQAGIPSAVDILIMTVTLPEEISCAADMGASVFIPDVERLRHLKSIARGKPQPVGFHIKVDTGMGRLGFLPCEARQVAEELRDAQNTRLLGIGTHLGASWADNDHTTSQIGRFREFVAEVKPLPDALLHVAASGGTIRIPEAYMTAVRTGSLTYGLNRIEWSPMPLKPALTYRTTVGQVKTLPVGWQIGYGTDRTVTRPLRVATLPVGVIDGISSSMCGRAAFLIGGAKCRLITVCMDSCIVEIPDGLDVKAGSEAVVIGSQGGLTVTGRELIIEAARTGFGTHLGHVTLRTPRVYYRGGRQVGMMWDTIREGVART